MTQKSNSRIVIDTNKHGIRRERNLDKEAQRSQKKRNWENKKKSYPQDIDISIVRSRSASVKGEIYVKRG
jgi:hypothetical protein